MRRAVWVVRMIAFVVVAVAIAGLAVMLLWNWLLPPLTGWHTLGYVQALALLALCRLLFGGFRGRGGRWGHGGLRQMSPEERERFREEMRARCGGGRSQAQA
jgi:hypothetical protein